MGFNQQEYINSYDKNKYKSYHFRVRKMRSVLTIASGLRRQTTEGLWWESKLNETYQRAYLRGLGCVVLRCWAYFGECI